MNTTQYDTIVLGLGAMGSATTYQLAKRGNKVLGIDQFSPPHHFGSSHGDTRITRQAIGEGAEYVPLVLRSYELFREIEKETGRDLLTVTGGLIISSKTATSYCHVEAFFQNTVDAAKKYNIEHEILTAEQMRKRFPQFNVADNEEGYYEPGAGFLRPEECIAAQLELAKKYGAQVNVNEKVLSYEAQDNKVTVKTNQGEYTAKKLIISAGTWLPELLHEKHRQPFRVFRQVIYWFDINGSAKPYLPDKCPIFIWQLQSTTQGIYGFPALDEKGGMKIGTEQTEVTTHPDRVDRTVSPQEIKEFHETYVKKNFPGVSERCVKAAACLYNVTPDSGFVIDRHPDHKNVIVASPCSGHGFKHSAAIGETLAQLVTEGRSTIDLSKFSFKRFLAKNTEKQVQHHPKPSL